jgi:hypothetical protein
MPHYPPNQFIVIRQPSTPEEEGRETFIGSFETWAEAKEYIQKMDNEPGGFYFKGCHVIWEVPFPRKKA